jgi:lysophospholipase L1-like esterase
MALSPDLLDPNTPPEVVVTGELVPRETDPTLGVALAGAPVGVGAAKHTLVTIGDSLTHGMSSAAVFSTGLSWPALVASHLAPAGDAGFSYPSYGGPLDGLPVNIEALLRRLEAKFGDTIGPLEFFRVPFQLHSLLDANEDYWEGRSAPKPPGPTARYTNLGVYGWDLRDALDHSVKVANDRIAAHAPKDTLTGIRPDNDSEIAALSVLGKFDSTATQLTAAQALGADGGIDSLVVALGANNALQTIVFKRVAWSQAPGCFSLDTKGAYTVWNPVHFDADFARVVAAVRQISCNRVVLCTVPHVTIAPIGKGVNPANPGKKVTPGSRYFPYYCDPWIDESDFKPARHEHLTHQQARAIDSAVDQYNATIKAAVKLARGEGREWLLVDLCGILDGIAQRRFIDDDTAATANGWVPYDLPAPISDLTTRFFGSGPSGRTAGGIFGLDGVHPTFSAYGVVAKEVLDALSAAGVTTRPIDFADLRSKDTLNTSPPKLLNQIMAAASLISPLIRTASEGS